MAKRMKLFLFAIALLVTSLVGRAQEIIPHAVGLYITPRGVDHLNANIQDILFRNGISAESAFFSQLEFQTEEQTLEEMLGDQEDIQEMVRLVKENIRRFFVGLDLDRHKFSVNISDVELFVEWSQMNVAFRKANFSELDPRPPKLSMDLMLEASDLKLEIGKIDIEDKLHPFLGAFGLDKVELFMDKKQSTAFYLRLPVHIYKDNGKIQVKVDRPETNLVDIMLNAQFRSPLRMPTVDIRINDHIVSLDQSEVEGLFREKQEDLINFAQVEMQNWLESDSMSYINETLTELLAGDLMEVNHMDPPGAPKNSRDPKFEWGLELEDIGFSDDLIHLGLNGFIRDPKTSSVPRLSSDLISRKTPRVQTNKALEHDMILSLNQGFVNKIVQLSTMRGYFSKVELGDGQEIALTKMPRIILDGGQKPFLALEIEYNVEGMQSILVRNPIRIAFNINIDFEINRSTGKVKMIGQGADLDSVFLDSKYIRMLHSTVRSAVRDQIAGMQNELKGFEIIDEFPIPESLFGIDLKVNQALIDRSGHFLFYIDYAN